MSVKLYLKCNLKHYLTPWIQTVTFLWRFWRGTFSNVYLHLTVPLLWLQGYSGWLCWLPVSLLLFKAGMNVLTEKCTPGYNLYGSLHSCKASAGTQTNCSELVCKLVVFIHPSTTVTTWKSRPQTVFKIEGRNSKGKDLFLLWGKQMYFEIS